MGRCQRVLRYEPTRQPTRATFDHIHPDDVAHAKRELAAAIEAGRGEATYRVRHANGEWRWIEAVGVNLLDDPHVEAVVLNSRDITDRKRAEEALREEQAFSDAIIDTFPGIFYVVDEDGRFNQWNRYYTDILGYTDEEIPHLHPLDLLEGEEKDLVATRIADVFEHGSAKVAASLLTKDGRCIPFFLTGVRVFMHGKAYLAGVGMNLSEIRTAQSTIESLNEELQGRLDRMTALHEIDHAIIENLRIAYNATIEGWADPQRDAALH